MTTVRDLYRDFCNAYWGWRKPEAMARLHRWRRIKVDRNLRETMVPILREILDEPMPVLSRMFQPIQYGASPSAPSQGQAGIRDITAINPNDVGSITASTIDGSILM